MTKDVISLSISVLLLFRHYISHKITFGAPSSGGVLCSACGAFIAHGFSSGFLLYVKLKHNFFLSLKLWESCMSRDARKPVFWASDEVRFLQKPAQLQRLARN